jgi:hypothetical protein
VAELIAANSFDTGIQKLISRYGKCFNSGCDYVEKLFKYVRNFMYNSLIIFPIACFNSSPEVTFRIALYRHLFRIHTSPESTVNLPE